MRKKIIRHGQCLLNQIGCASIIIVIAVVGKKERSVAFQAVVSTFVFFKGVERGRRHRSRDGLRGDFLLGRLHACGKGIDIRLIRLERDGRIGLLKAGAHLPARFVDGNGSLIGHLRKWLERAVDEAVERVFRKQCGLVCAGERAQSHVGQPVFLRRNGAGQVVFHRSERRSSQDTHQIAGCTDGSGEIGIGITQVAEGISKIETRAVRSGRYRRGTVEYRPGYIERHRVCHLKTAFFIPDGKPSGTDGGLGLDGRSDANTVVGIGVVVGVRPPAFGNGCGIEYDIFPVGQSHDISGGVLRAQPCTAAKVAWNRTGSAAVCERKIERYVASGADRQPIGNLLSIVKF